MADFTLTVTLSGNVVGRSLSFTHSHTISGITEFGEDNAELDINALHQVFSHDGTRYRGRSSEIASNFIMVQNDTQNGAVYTEVGDGVGSVDLVTVYGWPRIFYHSDSYDSCFMYSVDTPGSPSRDAEYLTLATLDGPLKVNAIALFKAIS